MLGAGRAATALCLAACLASAALARAGRAAEEPSSPKGLASSRATVPAPPFRHVLLFSGGSLDIHTLFGIYDAAVASGNPPDLLIATCGGALGAAIIRSIPDPAERAAFTASREFYDYMRKIRYTDLSLLDVYSDLRKIAHLAVEQTDPASPHRVVPDAFFERSIMHPENRYHYDEIDIRFDAPRPGAPEVVILANRLLYGREDVGKPVPPGTRLYVETVFCSERVARLLRAMPLRSAVNAAFPDSFIAPEVSYETEVPLGAAARHSYSDPYLVPVDGPYLTGAVNELTAYEITRLAREATIRYPPQWDRIDGNLMKKFFGHDPWTATERYTSLYADRWVDTTDRDYKSLARNIGFAPTPRALATLGIRVTTNVPKLNHRRFLKLVEQQHEYGSGKYLQAAAAPRNSRDHIVERMDLGLSPDELKRVRAENLRQLRRD